ncbi:MAG: dihydrodipicolinate synthase family protein [Candidatus Dormibacteraeota bacterium]|nr:dihydrodipicolinate synthase family protein [Candidatus Dormibacteraeota bacterium]
MTQRRTLAAAVTPLTAGGAEPDADGIGRVVDFYAESGLDGVLALGTTGEGVLLSLEQRRVAAQRFVEASNGRLVVFVHCGALSTHDTAALCADAAAAGASAVAVIAPPYYALDEASLLAHFAEAAAACAPLPFYVYEFAARSGYAVPPAVLAELRERAANFSGLKVSDSPYDAVRPYIIDGLEVFIGAEQLIHDGLRDGAAGAVSGLAAALPEVALRAVRSGSAEDSAAAARCRAAIQRFPFQAALKVILRARGVQINGDVRAPLRTLTVDEQRDLEAWLAGQSTAVSAAVAPS